VTSQSHGKEEPQPAPKLGHALHLDFCSAENSDQSCVPLPLCPRSQFIFSFGLLPIVWQRRAGSRHWFRGRHRFRGKYFSSAFFCAPSYQVETCNKTDDAFTPTISRRKYREGDKRGGHPTTRKKSDTRHLLSSTMARKESTPGQRFACDRPGCNKVREMNTRAWEEKKERKKQESVCSSISFLAPLSALL
jgi:hypothetical protein